MEVSFDMDNSFNEVSIALLTYVLALVDCPYLLLLFRYLLPMTLLFMVDFVRWQHLIGKS